jgi:oxygen-independent coproporphyrinogen-3 oxidase
MLGIYIHIPFCVSKCAYCDFTSVPGDERADGYLGALEAEMEMAGRLYAQPADSVFLGGGTPGHLKPGRVARLMGALRSRFDVRDGAEITIETNPCAVTREKLDEYIAAGIGRLSLGLQAAQDSLLAFLGRRHSLAAFDSAFDLARKAGFRNVNIDLIYAIPGQSMENWEETLYHALYKKPEHISAYALSIEKGTPLFGMLEAGKIDDVEADTAADMYEAAQRLLAQKGYVNYEVSNFAAGGAVCAHNMKYWTLQNYLGLGAAAHSNIGRLRFANTEDIDAYIRQMETGAQHYASAQYLDDKARRAEYAMLRLRLKDGLPFEDYKKQFRVDFEKTYAEGIKLAVRHGLAEVREGRLLPTAKGFALQNTLAGIFF